MRKIILLFCTALAIMSCGASRSTLGKHKEHSPAQIYAEDINRTTMRAWGMRTGTAAMNLEAYAAAAARAVLAENTSTLISRTIKDLEGEDAVRSIDLESSAKEVIKGSRVVMSDRYVNKDGSETCYVAVEISLDDILMNIRHAEAIKEALSKASGDKIVDVDSDKFAETLNNSFNNIKEESNFLDVSLL